MWPFGGGGGKGGKPSRGRIPTSRVMSLSSQGVSEPEIIKILRDEGYSPMQVDQAMKEALKSSVGAGGMMPPPAPPAGGFPGEEQGLSPPPGRGAGVPTLPSLTEDEFGYPSTEEPLPPAGMSTDIPEIPGSGFGPPLPGEEPIPRLREPMTKLEMKEDRRRALEELAESIIEEKWAGLKEEIMNLKSEIGETNLKVASLEQSLMSIRGERKSEMEQMGEKIDSYKTSINQVSAKMESIERAMKDSLTPMMQSMRSLTDTIRTMKGSK